LNCENESNCVYCINGFNISINNDKKICLEKCPEKTFLSTSSNKCEKCSEYCLDCSNARSCNRCEKDYFLENGECKFLCSKGNFINEFKKCEECQKGCASCIGKSQCKICQDGLVLKNGLCSDKCEVGFTNLNNQGICVKCDPDCIECNNFNPNVCRRCFGNKVLFDGMCTDKCPVGYTEEIELFDNLLQTSLIGNTVKRHNIDFNLNNLNKENKKYAIINALNNNINKRLNKELEKDTLNFKVDKLNFKICKKCPTGCENCTGKTNNNCTLCKEPLGLKNGECTEICSNDETSIKIEGLCVECERLNESFKNCKRCKASFTNSNKKIGKNSKIKAQILNLLIPKEQKINENHLSIRTNSNNLNLIKDIFEISCKECLDKFSLNIINNDCVSECPEKTFKTKSKTGISICDNCPQDCKTCENATKCIQCENGLKLDSNGLCSPLLTCSGENMFYSSINKKCQTCELENCLQCDGTKDGICKICKNDFIMDLKNNICVQSKNYNTCPAKCIDCDNKESCKKCEDGFLLEEGNCVERCSDNYIEKNFKCIRCEQSNCKICNKNNLNECEICKNNYKLKNGECVTHCKNGFFEKRISEDNIRCNPCNDNCEKCLDEKSCLKCFRYKLNSNRIMNVFDFNKHKINLISVNKENNESNHFSRISPYGDNDQYYNNNDFIINERLIKRNNLNSNEIIYYLMQNICVRECIENYSSDSINQICKKCSDPFCLKCSSENEQICEKCQNGFLLSNGKCHKECPPGSYLNTKNNTCEYCNSEFCTSCKNNHICDSCKTPKVLNANGMCIEENCSPGYVNINGVCKKCSVQNCEYCSQDLKNCYSCQNNLKLVKQKNICTSDTDCPDYYHFNEEEKVCEKCPDVNCLRCDATYTEVCLKCNSLSYLNKESKKCDSKCGKTFVFIDKQGKCIECDKDLISTCLVCDPLDIKKCLRCDQEQPLKYLYKNKCYAKCPIKSFLDKQTNDCLECPNNCDECSNEFKCDKCQVGFYLNHNNECVEACLDGYFSDKNGKCEKCEAGNLCKICDIKDKNKCIECKNGLFLDLIKNQCVITCPDGTMVSGSNCISCGNDCLKCENINKCKICKADFFNFEGKCIEKCPEGYYSNKYKGECIACQSKDCLSCNGEAQEKCFKCKQGKVLYQGNCIDKCPTGTIDNEKNGFCIGN